MKKPKFLLVQRIIQYLTFMPLLNRLAATALLSTVTLFGVDQPQWGTAWERNMVSGETNLPASFDPKTGANIKWRAKLGTESHGTPIVAGGRVYAGTNNGEPRDPRHEGDRGVLMCFSEATGELLWQLVAPKREEDPYHDWPRSGISSPPTIEGDRVYIVSNRGEVLCLDAKGFANGNDGPFKDEGKLMARTGTPALTPGPLDADVIWHFNLTEQAGIWSHDGAHSSILIRGDHLYLNSGTGVDNTHKKIRTPDAPSLIVLDKKTGKYLAREREGIAPDIFHCTWSPPSMARIDNKETILFPAGNGILYAFEPYKGNGKELATLKKLWWYDFDPAAPKTNVHGFNGNRRESPSNFYGMAVPHKGRVYLAGGGDIFWGKNEAWLKCIDPRGTGDLTKNATVWTFPLEKHVLSTPAVYEDMVFIADTGQKLYCLDASTGKLHWTHHVKGEVWASPYVADGKVYLGTRRGHFVVLKAAKDREVLGSIDLVSAISATATAANGVLYVSTMTDLFAVQQQSTTAK